jgi:hypothetical protein
MPTRHLRFGRACGVVLLVALALGGCKGDEPLVATEEQFCAEQARRECEKIGVVCGRNPSDCQRVRSESCRKDGLVAKQQARTFRPENAEGCLNAVSATYDNKLILAEHWRALRDACARVFEGPGQANQACAADPDCVAPLVCDRHLCGRPSAIASGGGCANPGETCPGDEYCRPGAGFAMCTKRHERAAVCDGTELCQADLRCRGTCMDRLADGNACDHDDDCQSGYCNQYTRPGAPHTCTRGLSFGTDSPVCDAYFGVVSTPVDALSTTVDALLTPGDAATAVDAGAAGSGDAASAD